MTDCWTHNRDSGCFNHVQDTHHAGAWDGPASKRGHGDGRRGIGLKQGSEARSQRAAPWAAGLCVSSIHVVQSRNSFSYRHSLVVGPVEASDQDVSKPWKPCPRKKTSRNMSAVGKSMESPVSMTWSQMRLLMSALVNTAPAQVGALVPRWSLVGSKVIRRAQQGQGS